MVCPCMDIGSSGLGFWRKSTIISSVFFVFSSSLFSRHQSINFPTSVLYAHSSHSFCTSLPSPPFPFAVLPISPTTVVSSENLMSFTEGSEETQSLVYSVKREGESTHAGAHADYDADIYADADTDSCADTDTYADTDADIASDTCADTDTDIVL